LKREELLEVEEGKEIVADNSPATIRERGEKTPWNASRGFNF
jgi:hypothetical protein